MLGTIENLRTALKALPMQFGGFLDSEHFLGYNINDLSFEANSGNTTVLEFITSLVMGSTTATGCTKTEAISMIAMVIGACRDAGTDKAFERVIIDLFMPHYMDSDVRWLMVTFGY